MAQGDPPPGLLSKVAKFVTNPTKDWSELDRKEPEQESGYSKEALKEMIERKRQNDFVRKREFDHLRKLRRREPSANPGQGGRPSFFQSSLTSNIDERAETLKKIDEIEAQMSHQWWKGKKEDGAARISRFPPSAQEPMRAPSVQASSNSSSSELDNSRFQSTAASDMQGASQWKDSPQEQLDTRMSEVPRTDPMPVQSAAPSPRPISRPQPLQKPAPRMPIGAGFSTNRLFAVELADSLTDPDLEEAAIRFANGDDAGAEEVLLGALQGQNLRPASAEAWMSALFDLYRATGQQARFESVALEFASRFGRSAPAWFSTPELLARKRNETAKSGNKPAPGANSRVWRCPALLSGEALEELKSQVQRSNTSALLQLDWQALEEIAPEALDGLVEVFAYMCSAPMQLAFGGYDVLERVLRSNTPSGDRGVSPSNWQLRMDALRVMRLQDEFELVALEYCVTFEVSPPSWQEARSSCQLEGATVGDPLSAADLDDDPKSGWGSGAASTNLVGLDGEPPAVVELAGEIVGDAADALARLEAGMEGATRMVISCARLIRVDFSAAGSILNWVVAQEANGCKVQFRDVNRIVAAFFNVIGINEHARVVPGNA